MTALFPPAGTPDEFEAIARDESCLAGGLRAVVDRLGITATPRRYDDGSLPVYALGTTLTLKLYPPFDRRGFEAEQLVLEVLDRRLPVPTPSVESAGELEGWGYILMTQLEGVGLARAWPEIPPDEQPGLAEAVGRTIAALHAVRDPRLEPVRIDWPTFRREQVASAADRQRRRGLDESWVEQIPDFLADVTLEDDSADTLLHTEIMREHLRVTRGPAGWRLSGLFDFEPAMVGAPGYEFASVGLFVSCGEPALLRRVLLAAGFGPADLTPELERRLMAWALLHRYSHLGWYLRRMPPPPGARRMSDLAVRWFGLTDLTAGVSGGGVPRPGPGR